MDNESNKSELTQLTDHMADLGRMFEKANRQIVDYLLQRDSQVAAEDKETAPSVDTSDLSKQIAALGEKLDGLGKTAPTAVTSSARCDFIILSKSYFPEAISHFGSGPVGSDSSLIG